MSIYPVRCKKWWVAKKSYDPEHNRILRLEREIIKNCMSSHLKCTRCGKRVKDWDKAYVSHAFVYGVEDAYCNINCLKNNPKKRAIKTLQGGHMTSEDARIVEWIMDKLRTDLVATHREVMIHGKPHRISRVVGIGVTAMDILEYVKKALNSNK